MSTKSTIARVSEYTWLEEDMIDDTTWLAVNHPNMALHGNSIGAQLRLHLTSSLLDKIAEIHAHRGFPHQRAADSPASPNVQSEPRHE